VTIGLCHITYIVYIAVVFSAVYVVVLCFFYVLIVYLYFVFFTLVLPFMA